MAKLLFVCRRSQKTEQDTLYWQLATKALDKALSFDLIHQNSQSVNVHKENTYLYIFNPIASSISQKGFNVCLGGLGKPDKNWETKERVPNAPLTILHQHDDICLYADVLGSRSVWVYQDDELFMASTSQRAMVIYLQSFVWNPQAATWMLATGCTGPGYGWDKRFASLGPGGIMRFNKVEWKIRHTNTSINFNPCQKDKYQLKVDLADLLEDSIGKVNIDLASFALTLSGGYDSRAALFYLKEKISNTLCWGLQEAQADKMSDAYVAQKLAHQLQRQHHFLEADQRDVSFETIVDNFVRAGEGRVDHIQTHTDGLAMWTRVANEGYHGIVRADEVFGWLPVQSELDARLSTAFNLLEDFANLKPAQAYELEPQRIPDFYRIKSGEALEDWRDRLYQQYRISYIQTGLHEIVYPFVELVNPLLLDDIVNFTHTLPANWRTSKRLYAEIVRELIPAVPFASKPAIPEVEHITQDPTAVRVMQEEVTSIYAQHYISPTLIRNILPKAKMNIQAARHIENNWQIRAKQLIPFRIKKLLRHSIVKYKMDYNQLMFRNYLILRVAQRMEEDSQILREYA